MLAANGEIETAKQTVSIAAPWLPNLFPSETQPGESTAVTRWLLVLFAALTFALTASREIRERGDATSQDFDRVQQQAIEQYEGGLDEIDERPAPSAVRRRYLSAAEVRAVLFANGGARELSELTGIPFPTILHALDCGADGFEGYILGALFEGP